MKDINARFENGRIIPKKPLDVTEAEDIRPTLDAVEANVQAADAALARAIVEGLATRPVSRRRVLAVLWDR